MMHHFVKHSFALSFSLSVAAVYALYGLLLHFMPHMYVRFYAQLHHMHEAAVSIPSLEHLAIGTAQVFVISFVAAFLFALVHNSCSQYCCDKQ